MSPPPPDDPPRWYGKYRGKVTDVADPQGLGRIRARVPEVLGDVDTGWALPCAPLAGDNLGFFAVPKPGSGVWVEFEAGDVSRPLWTGGFWGEKQVPKGASDNATTPSAYVLRSAHGLLVSLDDQNKTVAIGDASGGDAITIEVNSGTVKVKGASKVVLEGQAIELVENASHAVVLGDELLKYLGQIVSTFASHTHPGAANAGGPVPPVPPVPQLPQPPPSLLSTKVKSG